MKTQASALPKVLIWALITCGCSHSTDTTNQPEALPEDLPGQDFTGTIAFVNVNFASR
jgi:hypothetical protein